MRIVQVNETCGTNSIGRTTLELARELEKKGHECLVAYSHDNLGYQNAVRIGSDFDHKVHAVLSRITGLQGYFSYRATKQLLKRLDEFKPEVVHLGNLHSNYVNLKELLMYCSKKRIPVVVTLHDCWLFTGKCTYYIPAKCEKWKEKCGNCPLLHKDNVNPTLFFDRTTKCITDKKKWFDAIPKVSIVGVSEWVANEAKSSIFSKRNPIAIYNWIDLNIFRPRESEIRKQYGLEGKYVILCVAASISRIKGYDEIVTISKGMPENWRIVAIGKETLPLPENIIHISHTNDAVQLAEFYTMADVCMNTTQYETFGMVTAEAICCGTPAVVYNNTATPELVDDGCGIIVNQADGVAGILKALKEIETNGKKYYTEACLNAARNRFGKDIGVNKYIELYESLVHAD